MQEYLSHNIDFSTELSAWVQSQEMMADPITRRDYFEHLNSDDFLDLTQQIASIIRTGDSRQRQHFDGEDVSLMFHEVPDQRDKEQILRETWQTAKSFLTDRSIPDEDALEYAALTVATGLLWAHPFADGNGRTSRVLSYLMARGQGKEGELKIIMTESSPKEWQVFVSPRMIPRETRNMLEGQPTVLEWEGGMAGEMDDALGGLIANMNFKDNVFFKFLALGDNRVKEIVEPFIARGKGGLRVLDADKALEALVHDPERGMEFAQRFLDLRRQELSNYIRRFMGSITTKVSGPFRVVTQKQLDSNHKDSFSQARTHVLKNEVNRRRMTNGTILPRDEMVIWHRSFSTVYHDNFDIVDEPTPKEQRLFRK